MNTSRIFFNQPFDKKRLKALIEWILKRFGEKEALRVVEELKRIGFQNATQAGLSLGLHELTTPPEKRSLVSKAQIVMNSTDQDFNGARVTATERSQRIVDTWHRVSETLREQVVDHFSSSDQLNPIYIMALSGARGNFSQVRQLVGMRGLMADPQGQIINFPIRSNLREGLTLTEYFISCSGARKGLVDTALRTADTGYLTRRLVDVSHHIVVKRVSCNSYRGVTISGLQSKNKTLFPLRDRLVGRVLAEQISRDQTATSSHTKETARQVALLHPTRTPALLSKQKFDQRTLASTLPSGGFRDIIARRDQEISPDLAAQICLVRRQVVIRSPLTCALKNQVCQLCYGWSLSHGNLVPLGEAVGVIAAQSIGEPGTQLTMRTFHTGGVFSGDLLQEIRAPHSGKIRFSQAFQGLLIRTAHGRVAFLTKTPGEIVLTREWTNTTREERSTHERANQANRTQIQESVLPIQSRSMLFVRQGEQVEKDQLLAEISDLGKEGNQPVQSQQTIFAELYGRVIDLQGGNLEKDELDRQVNQENKKRNQIEPGRSGGLGLFEILATRIGATMNPYPPAQHISSSKPSQMWPLQRTAHQGCTPFQEDISLVESYSNTRNRHSDLTDRTTKLGARNRAGHCLFLNRTLTRQGDNASFASYHRQNQYQSPPSIRQSEGHGSAPWAGTKTRVMPCQLLANRLDRDVSRLDLFVLKESTLQKNTSLLPLTCLHPKLAVSQASCTNAQVGSTCTIGSTVQSLDKNRSFPTTRPNGASPETVFPTLLSKRVFDLPRHLVDLRRLRPSCLNTIAEEGDLVDENYKDYAHFSM